MQVKSEAFYNLLGMLGDIDAQQHNEENENGNLFADIMAELNDDDVPTLSYVEAVPFEISDENMQPNTFNPAIIPLNIVVPIIFPQRTSGIEDITITAPQQHENMMAQRLVQGNEISAIPRDDEVVSNVVTASKAQEVIKVAEREMNHSLVQTVKYDALKYDAQIISPDPITTNQQSAVQLPASDTHFMLVVPPENSTSIKTTSPEDHNIISPSSHSPLQHIPVATQVDTNNSKLLDVKTYKIQDQTEHDVGPYRINIDTSETISVIDNANKSILPLIVANTQSDNTVNQSNNVAPLVVNTNEHDNVLNTPLVINSLEISAAPPNTHIELSRQDDVLSIKSSITEPKFPDILHGDLKQTTNGKSPEIVTNSVTNFPSYITVTASAPKPILISTNFLQEQISFHLTQTIKGKQNSTTFSLQPEMLGKVKINFETNNDTGYTNVFITTERQMTAELLNIASKHIHDSLVESGMNPESFSLEIGAAASQNDHQGYPHGKSGQQEQQKSHSVFSPTLSSMTPPVEDVVTITLTGNFNTNGINIKV